MMLESVAVYIHIPFCPTKCGYCDFNSYAMTGEIIPRTVEAIRTEILRSPWKGVPAKTIFFGGGTPTLIESDALVELLHAVCEAHPPIEGCEITSEANPGTADASKFRTMFEGGFRRLSLGAQSFHSEDLVRLGRVHSTSEIGRAIQFGREAGFQNMNLDLMFALPGQRLRQWESNLDLALSLKPDHLSLYGLTIEPNTRFHRLDRKGMLDLPSEEDQLKMYEIAIAKAREAGLEQYEISNFATPGKECQHNLCYWRNECYIGYGPGAVGKMPWENELIRYTVMKHPERYSAGVESGEAHGPKGRHWCDFEYLNPNETRFEQIMLGIRLTEGLNLAKVNLSEAKVIDCAERGWVEVQEGRLRLTATGKHLASEVIARLG